jgi:hypothetical protein
VLVHVVKLVARVLGHCLVFLATLILGHYLAFLVSSLTVHDAYQLDIACLHRRRRREPSLVAVSVVLNTLMILTIALSYLKIAKADLA